MININENNCRHYRLDFVAYQFFELFGTRQMYKTSREITVNYRLTEHRRYNIYRIT